MAQEAWHTSFLCVGMLNCLLRDFNELVYKLLRVPRAALPSLKHVKALVTARDSQFHHRAMLPENCALVSHSYSS